MVPVREIPRKTKLTLAIMMLFREFRYLRSSFVYPLLKERGVKCSEDSVKRKLQHMTDPQFGQEILMTPGEQFTPGQTSTGTHLIYCMKEKGHKLCDEWELNPFVIAFPQRRKPSPEEGEFAEEDVKLRNFWHALYICDVMASIYLGHLLNNLGFIPHGKILSLMPNPERTAMPFKRMYESELVKGKLVLDELYGTQYPSNPRKPSFTGLELENTNSINRSKLSSTSFKRKGIGYVDIEEKKTYKEVFNTQPRPLPNLKILVATINQAKSDSQREFIEEYVGSSDMFRFTTFPNQSKSTDPISPFPEILTTPCQRAGMDPIPLYNKDHKSVGQHSGDAE
tara:strand:- start:7651 stop:8667 length:1017 start_codon:yes stop_codon:yes gene_type:complete